MGKFLPVVGIGVLIAFLTFVHIVDSQQRIIPTAEKSSPRCCGAEVKIPVAERAKPEEPTESCAATRKEAVKLLAEFDRGLSADDRKQAETDVGNAGKRGRSQADGYNAFSGGALLAGQFKAAAWGALKAASLEWRPHSVCNVGVCLFYLDRLDEAERFLNCAREMAPSSPFALEGLALLAFKKKDCLTATKLIDQAVRMMPDDTNILYSAGFIHYRCRDTGAAKRYMRQAEARRPNDKTIKAALKVIDPDGTSAPPPRPNDCLAHRVDECLRFLDAAHVWGEAEVDFSNRIQKIRGKKDSIIDIKDLRRRIEEQKKRVVDAEKQARDLMAKANKPWVAPGYWNVALAKCAGARLLVTQQLEGMHINSGAFHVEMYADAFDTDPERIMQRAMTETNRNNSERMSLLLQGERRKYEDVENGANKKLTERLAACAKLDTAAERVKCIEAAYRAACSEILPAFRALKSASEANTSTAVLGFPRAGNNQVLRLSAVAGREIDYIARAIACMKALPKAPGEDTAFYTPEGQIKVIQKSYGIVFGGLGDLLKSSLTSEKDSLLYEVKFISGYVANRGKTSMVKLCQQESFKPKSLADEWNTLIDALKDASKFEAGVDPECELKIGDWSTSVKLFGDNPANLKVSSDAWSLKGKADLQRWGAEVSVSESANVGPVTGKVGVKIWVEDRRNAPMDYGVEASGKVGFGYKKEGVGGITCYLIQAKGNVNLRILADRLLAN